MTIYVYFPFVLLNLDVAHDQSRKINEKHDKKLKGCLLIESHINTMKGNKGQFSTRRLCRWEQHGEGGNRAETETLKYKGKCVIFYKVVTLVSDILHFLYFLRGVGSMFQI